MHWDGAQPRAAGGVCRRLSQPPVSTRRTEEAAEAPSTRTSSAKATLLGGWRLGRERRPLSAPAAFSIPPAGTPPPRRSTSHRTTSHARRHPRLILASHTRGAPQSLVAAHCLCSEGSCHPSLGCFCRSRRRLSSLSRTTLHVRARAALSCANAWRAPRRLTQPCARSPGPEVTAGKDSTKDTFSFRSHTNTHDGAGREEEDTVRRTHRENAGASGLPPTRRTAGKHARAESTTPALARAWTTAAQREERNAVAAAAAPASVDDD